MWPASADWRPVERIRRDAEGIARSDPMASRSRPEGWHSTALWRGDAPSLLAATGALVYAIPYIA